MGQLSSSRLVWYTAFGNQKLKLALLDSYSTSIILMEEDQMALQSSESEKLMAVTEEMAWADIIIQKLACPYAYSISSPTVMPGLHMKGVG